MTNCYKGKITEIGRDAVTVCIFDYGKDKEEIVGEISRDSFPRGKLYPGRMLNYFPRRVPHIEFIRKKPVSDKAIAEMRGEVEKMLEGIFLDI